MPVKSARARARACERLRLSSLPFSFGALVFDSRARGRSIDGRATADENLFLSLSLYLTSYPRAMDGKRAPVAAGELRESSVESRVYPRV